jgi:hypothetical protein
MNMQHGHGLAARTWTCSVDIYMQRGHLHAAWTLHAASKVLDMQHQWTWTCSIKRHGHSASIDMGMQHGPGHAARTWTYSIDMDMDMDINYYWEVKGLKDMIRVRRRQGVKADKVRNFGLFPNSFKKPKLSKKIVVPRKD